MFQRLSERSGKYPLPDLPSQFKQAIVDAIGAAWQVVLSSSTQFANENEATSALVEALRTVRSLGTVAAFTDYFFQTPSRDACETNFSGSILDKRPDIHLRLVGSFDDHHGWFVECKIVDARHAPRLYVQRGVVRYVNGDYAWAMPSALMIAYAADGCSIAGDLVRHLPQPSVPLPAGVQVAVDSCRTRHARAFSYVGSNRQPGEIELVHLWLPGGSFA